LDIARNLHARRGGRTPCDDAGMTEVPRWETIEPLLRAADRNDLAQIRALVRQAIAANRDDDDIGCGDELYALCFLLYLVGDPDDALLVHEAKYLNMDTGVMIDRDLLTMRRDRDTMLRAIAALPAGVAPPLLVRDLTAAFDDPKFESPALFEASLRGYFGVAAS
jgi:hypothetical protein